MPVLKQMGGASAAQGESSVVDMLKPVQGQKFIVTLINPHYREDSFQSQQVEGMLHTRIPEILNEH